jgi:hypothetical protein
MPRARRNCSLKGDGDLSATPTSAYAEPVQPRHSDACVGLPLMTPHDPRTDEPSGGRVLHGYTSAPITVSVRSMRTFTLFRHHDVSGVSGTGTVAEGVVFSDGRCALRWVAPDVPSGTGTYDSIGDVIRIHGHRGATSVVWRNEDAPRSVDQDEWTGRLTPVG